jgi:hypothetical protein
MTMDTVRDFDKQELVDLLREFKRSVKRRQDESLAARLESELLEARPPRLTQITYCRLAKWCSTSGIYADGMEVAKRISYLVFGAVLDRGQIGI